MEGSVTLRLELKPHQAVARPAGAWPCTCRAVLGHGTISSSARWVKVTATWGPKCRAYRRPVFQFGGMLYEAGLPERSRQIRTGPSAYVGKDP